MMDDNDLALLHQKIDILTEQLETQRKRQERLDDLMSDMIPIGNHLVRLTIEELDDIGAEFQLEDLLYLLKRLLRNSRRLVQMFDYMDMAADMADEVDLLSKQVFNQAVEELNRLEREGYFALVRGGMYAMEQIVTEFGEEDVRALGDNIVTILKTVRNMTQPEIMVLADNAVNAIRDDGTNGNRVSTWTLVREFGDPKVRRGLARLLNMVKALADQPELPTTN